MKRTLLVLLSLSLATVFAQAEDVEDVPNAPNNYGAVMTTVSAFEGQYGFKDLLAPQADLRLRFGLAPFFGFGAYVGADALFGLSEPGTGGFYAGPGLTVGRGGGLLALETGVAVMGTIGQEIVLDRASIVNEIGTGIGYGFGEFGGFSPAVRFAVGIKFDF